MITLVEKDLQTVKPQDKRIGVGVIEDDPDAGETQPASAIDQSHLEPELTPEEQEAFAKLEEVIQGLGESIDTLVQLTGARNNQ